jgi:hypothetical protein
MLLQRPLSRLEMSLAAAILGVAALAFMDRALDVMELAERTAMQATVSNINSAVNTRFAFETLKRAGTTQGWQKLNPFQLAQMDVPTTDWTYDAARSELVYQPRLRRHLRTADPEGQLRFRLVPHRAGMGYLLQPVGHYEWTSTAIQVLPSISLQGLCFT